MARPMADGDWRLSFDVVSSIMTKSPPPTISALMQSCHALYVEGPRHLLRDGVGLHNEIQTILFTNFMLVQDPSRLALLRKIELAFSFPYPMMFSEETSHRLGQLLSHPALALETLVLHGASLVLVRNGLMDSILCSALGRLDKLKHLVLHGVGVENGPVIQALPSKLESAAIGIDRPLVESLWWARFDLLSSLRPFSDTLHTILVKLQPASPALSLLTNGGSHTFPHVRTFGIVCDDSTPALFASPALAQTFPALTHVLLIPSTLDRHGRRRRRRLEMANGLREGNQARSAQHPAGGAFPALSSLVECSGQLFDVYALALDRPLATLRLWQYVEPADLPILRAVLGDTRPGRLCLNMEMDEVGMGFAALHALLARPSPRVDLTLSLSPAFWGSLYVKEDFKLPKFLHLLAALLRACPPGLAELNLFFELPCDAHPALRAIFNDNLVVLEKWAAGAAPSLRFSCRIAVDEDWQWPDLGQDEFREDPIGMLETMFDDDDDDYGDFGEEDGDGDEDGNGDQEEAGF